MASKVEDVETYDEVEATPRQPRTGFTYEHLRSLPEDNVRREILDGELIVTAAPSLRHQRVVMELSARLHAYARECGAEVFSGPTDVYLSSENVLEPDIVYVASDQARRLSSGKYVEGPPTVVVEVSSPSTRSLDLVRKLDLYQRFGVPEYWFIDLEAGRIERYELEGKAYGRPELFTADDTFRSPQLDGFSFPVAEVLPTSG